MEFGSSFALRAVAFPALAISERNSFFVIQSMEELATCSTAGWRNGFYQSLALLDSSGMYWPIEARLKREPSLIDRMLNRRLEVELSVRAPLSDGVNRAIAKICDSIDHDPDDLYDQFLSHAELKRRFQDASEVQQVFHLAETLGGERA